MKKILLLPAIFGLAVTANQSYAMDDPADHPALTRFGLTVPPRVAAVELSDQVHNTLRDFLDKIQRRETRLGLLGVPTEQLNEYDRFHREVYEILGQVLYNQLTAARTRLNRYIELEAARIRSEKYRRTHPLPRPR